MLSTTDLATTTLAELNASAGLLTRVDRKYLVAADQAQSLTTALSQGARVLEIDSLRSFAYSSTYFDTPGLDSYLLAARKRRRRFKVRTRTYVDSGLAFLEVKTRGARGTTVKNRVPWPATAGRADTTTHLDGPARHFIAECLTDAEVATPAQARELVAALAPVLSTTYQRTTLHLPQAASRVTIDEDLVWYPGALPAPGQEAPSRPAAGMAIIETKSPGGPSPADRALWAAGQRPTKVSKYATGLALLNPGLPANKWHRVMHRDLGAAQAA